MGRNRRFVLDSYNSHLQPTSSATLEAIDTAATRLGCVIAIRPPPPLTNPASVNSVNKRMNSIA